MSIKLHVLLSHLDKLPSNPGAVSDEQGERFHQDVITMKHHYQGRWDRHMMADYCKNIKPQARLPRGSLQRKFLTEQANLILYFVCMDSTHWISPTLIRILIKILRLEY